MPQQFQYRVLDVPNRDIHAPDGTVMNAGRTPGARITHWMDSAQATGHFEYARRMALSIINPWMRRQAGPFGTTLAQAFGAIARGFNACNIPWYMHPNSRRLWRAHVAGGPRAFPRGSDDTRAAQFGRLFYNESWFGSEQYPGFNPSLVNDQAAQLVHRVPQLLEPGETKLAHTIWPNIQVPAGFLGSSASAERSPWYAPVVTNAVLLGGFLDYRVVDDAPPAVWQPDDVIRSANDPDGTDVTRPGESRFDAMRREWDLFGFGLGFFGGDKRVGVPEIFYASWLEEWTRDLVSKSPEEIVAEARVYTAWSNAQMAEAWGGADSLIQQATGLPGDVIRDRIASGPGQGLRIATELAAAVGGTVAAIAAAVPGPGTIVAGVAGLVTGAVVGVLSLVGASVQGVSATTPRDDLGRYKPTIDRGWLSGNPGLSDSRGMPTIEVPDPPGWVRPSLTVSPDILLGGAIGGTLAPPPRETGPIMLGNDLLLGGALNGTLVPPRPQVAEGPNWAGILLLVGAGGLGIYAASRALARGR